MITVTNSSVPNCAKLLCTLFQAVLIATFKVKETLKVLWLTYVIKIYN